MFQVRFLKSKQEDSNRLLQLRSRFISDDAVRQDSVDLVSPSSTRTTCMASQKGHYVLPQRVALASQKEWSFFQRVAFDSNALLKDTGVFINSTLWKAPITSLLALQVRNRGLFSDKKIILQKLYKIQICERFILYISWRGTLTHSIFVTNNLQSSS